jgi:omega-6 fatty acid desaturase (delta-12 desaturase)
VAGVLVGFDVAVLLIGFAGAIVLNHWLWKLAAGALMGLSIARLFVIGHDACHQSFFTGRAMNRIVGMMVFLPSLTTYSLWEAGHNLGHHVFTNLRGRDYVWTPLGLDEFAALPPWRKRLERFYRSGFGFGAYYFIELWWKHLFFPNEAVMPGRKPVHRRDSWLVSAFAAFWIAGVFVSAWLTEQSAAGLFFTAFVWPLFCWSCLMGAVIYFHHTHPQVTWYQCPDEWEANRDGISTTVHVTFRGHLGWLVNNIMSHPAHHLDARIPCYTIDQAQRALTMSGARVLEQPFSWRYVHDTVQRCKLYDYDNRRWTDFDGRVTSAVGRGPGGEVAGDGSKTSNVMAG